MYSEPMKISLLVAFSGILFYTLILGLATTINYILLYIITLDLWVCFFQATNDCYVYHLNVPVYGLIESSLIRNWVHYLRKF